MTENECRVQNADDTGPGDHYRALCLIVAAVLSWQEYVTIKVSLKIDT